MPVKINDERLKKAEAIIRKTVQTIRELGEEKYIQLCMARVKAETYVYDAIKEGYTLIKEEDEMDMQMIKDFVRDRNRAVRMAHKTDDMSYLKDFYHKWMKKGIYQTDLPDDEEVLKRTVRKMLYHISSASEEEKAEAKAWLEARGSDTNFW